MRLKELEIGRPTVARRILDRVGRTSLVALPSLEDGTGSRLWGKAEWENPGGSVKDRAVRGMILEAERSGLLSGGEILLDATSGNTGVALALLGRALGHPVEVVMPSNVTSSRKETIRALGARLVETDPLEGIDGAILEARRRHDAHPGRFAYLDQYRNEANWRAHHATTGPEIWEQTGGALTHFVAGLGTSGTFMGAGRRLRELENGVVLVSVQPESSLHGIEGLKHMETALVPEIYDPSLADRTLGIGTEEAYAMVRRLAREEGLLVGPSSGAAALAASRIAAEGPDRVVVTVLCDNGDRYFDETFWEEAGDPDLR